VQPPPPPRPAHAPQTLAGVIATATHGSSLGDGVMSTHVRALELMLPDGSVVRCSRAAGEDPDLFAASLCGLGATGLILSATLDVAPAFRLQEHQHSVPFDEALQLIPELAPAAEHFRAWWFPQADTVRLSMSNPTTDVSACVSPCQTPAIDRAACSP
jgi:L-gulonolactone oxidase